MDSDLSPEEIAYEKAHIDENRAAALIAPLVVFQVIALLCIVGRIISRKRSRVALGKDDWLIIVSMLFTNVLVVVCCLFTRSGVGRHTITVTREDRIQYAKTQYAFSITYPFSIGFTKISVLFLYRRVFSRSGKAFLWSVNVLVGLTVVWIIAYLVGHLANCHAPSDSWSELCTPAYAPPLILSTFDILLDVLVIALPQPTIWRLQTSNRVKGGLTVVTALGIFGIVCSCLRYPFFLRHQKEITKIDFFYTVVDLYLYSCLEAQITIICACLPTMQALLRRWFKKGASYMTSSKSRSGPIQSHMASTPGETQAKNRRLAEEKGFFELQDGDIPLSSVKTKTASEISVELPFQTQDLRRSDEEDINHVTPVYPKAYVAERV